MNVKELLAREDFDPILRETLARAWSDELGERVSVRAHTGRGQRWFLHPFLGVFGTSRAERRPRQFAADLFRYARPLHRLAPQWALGTALASRTGWRLARRRGFLVEPAVPRASSLLVMPSNQRVRIFDFDRGVVRAHQKEGFDTATMRTDVSVRGMASDGPFVPITHHDLEAGWIEEPLVDAVPLARCPPWRSRTRAEVTAFRLLDAWATGAVHRRSGDGYVESVSDELVRVLREVDERFGISLGQGVSHWVHGLSQLARRISELRLTMSHGDFQPGNILLPRDGGEPLLIDWEHAGDRSFFYDRLVYRLQTRWAGPARERIDAFVKGAPDPLMRPLPRDREWRRSALALFLLEDMLWFARESLSGPYRRPSTGLDRYVARIPQLATALGMRSP